MNVCPEKDEITRGTQSSEDHVTMSLRIVA